MVLTNSGIEKAFALNNQLKSDDELYNLIEVINFMEKDVNFQSFINGTTFGQDTYEKWKTLVKLVQYDLYQNLAPMTHNTDKFFRSSTS